MKIEGNAAILNRKERRLFGVDSVVTVGELACNEKLTKLCTERDTIRAEREQIRPPYDASTTYRVELRRLDRQIKIVAAAAEVVLAYETEQFLVAPHIDRNKSDLE